MQVVLTAEARADVVEAAAYYGLVRNRNGETFDEAFERAARKIIDNPNRGTRFGPRFRRVRLNRFPYGILFVKEDDETILITAVMHLRRSPKAWEERQD
jgi:plasmid stabilization system protein ParE